MTPQDLKNLLIKVTHTDLSDDDAYLYLNMAYKEFRNAIVNSKKNYNFEFWVTNVLSWLSEYTLKQPDVTEVNQRDKRWQQAVEKVFIKYDTDSDFVELKPRTRDTIEATPEYLKENQSQSDPIVIISDNSLFIYPTPDTVVTDWLLFYWYRKPYNLSDTTTSSDDILVPEQWRKVIVTGAKKRVYEAQQLQNEAEKAETDYVQQKRVALSSMAMRRTSVTQGIVPKVRDME